MCIQCNYLFMGCPCTEPRGPSQYRTSHQILAPTEPTHSVSIGTKGYTCPHSACRPHQPCASITDEHHGTKSNKRPRTEISLNSACRLHQPYTSSMDEHHETKPKRQRTGLDIRGKHHVIGRALAHVCKDIKLHGLCNVVSRQSLHRHRVDIGNRETPMAS